MKPLLFLLTLASVAAALKADEPKPQNQLTIDRINQDIEDLKRAITDEPKAQNQLTIDRINQDIEDLKRAIKVLDGQKKSLEKTTEEHTKFWKPPPPKTGIGQGTIIANNKEWGFVVIDSENARIITKALETGGVEYTTPKMSVEMAERHSAEKIKQLVREADAKAMRILNGNPPSQVHGN